MGVAPVYLTLMAAIEQRRRALGWPMWELEERAGLSEGYYSKMLHADNAPQGRQASWSVLQKIVDVLFAGKYAIKFAAVSPDSILTEARMQQVNESVRTYLRKYFADLGATGAKRRNERLSAAQRSAISSRAGKVGAQRRREQRERDRATIATAEARPKPRLGIGSVPITLRRYP